MFTIGEFSKITGLTVKTLRFYHQESLLVPSFVDRQSGYRYYQPSQIEVARVISYLRAMEFPLAEIKQIFQHDDQAEILDVLQRQKALLQQKIRQFKNVVKSIDQFISEERQASTMSQTEFNVEEKTLQPMLIAGIRMKGKYSDCGPAFSKIGRAMGRYLSGKPMMLHYDCEYKENDADFEPAMPVRQAKQADGIDVRQLPGGKCVALVHKGPYDQLGRSYAKILQYIKDKGYQITVPSREVYLKGPGMIFKGNPNNYLTEIQLVLA